MRYMELHGTRQESAVAGYFTDTVDYLLIAVEYLQPVAVHGHRGIVRQVGEDSVLFQREFEAVIVADYRLLRMLP